jgi:hypothetical protein
MMMPGAVQADEVRHVADPVKIKIGRNPGIELPDSTHQFITVAFGRPRKLRGELTTSLTAKLVILPPASQPRGKVALVPL